MILGIMTEAFSIECVPIRNLAAACLVKVVVGWAMFATKPDYLARGIKEKLELLVFSPSCYHWFLQFHPPP